MQKNKFYLILLAAAISVALSSCIMDDADTYVCPYNSTRIILNMGNMQEIRTRSEATDNERTISDA